MLNIPAHKLNGFGSGLVLGLDAFIKKTDYIGFGHIFSYDNPRSRISCSQEHYTEPIQNGIGISRAVRAAIHF